MCSPTKENVKQNISYHFKDIVQLSPEREVNSGEYTETRNEPTLRGLVVLVATIVLLAKHLFSLFRKVNKNLV